MKIFEFKWNFTMIKFKMLNSYYFLNLLGSFLLFGIQLNRDFNIKYFIIIIIIEIKAYTRKDI